MKPLIDFRVSNRKFQMGIIVLVLSIVVMNFALGQGLAFNNPKPEKTIELRSLSIGDKIPEIVLSNVYNFSSKTISLSEFKGKAIILDFWATWCGSCVESIPIMQKIQKKFNNKLQVLLVNSFMGDTEKKVDNFFMNRKARTGEAIELPYVLQDSITKKFFYHKGIPHFVWIDSNGIIAAITTKTWVTEKNVGDLIEGRKLNVPLKDDMRMTYNYMKPFLANGNGGDEADFLWRSVISRYKENVTPVIGKDFDDDGKVTRVYQINSPLISLFKTAFHEKFDKAYGRLTFIMASNPKRFLNKRNELDVENLYCYELNCQSIPYDESLKYMREDLSRYFQATVINETRKIDCYVLTLATKDSLQLLSKGGNPTPDIVREDLRKVMRNKPFYVLQDFVSEVLQKPVINETGITTNIDIDLPFDFFELDFPEIRRFLLKNGILIKEGTRDLNVAVIIDQ